MAKKTINTVAGNTAPVLTLTAERDDVVLNLTGCTVDLIITKSKVQTNTGHTGCVITDAANGVVTYARRAGDTAVSGSYPCDMKVTYSDLTFEILYDILVLKCRKPVTV